MSLNLDDKKAVVAEIAAVVANAQTIVIAEYRGIGVASMTALRKQARESGVFLRVLKNTLARRAVEGTPFASLADQMSGPLVYAISEDAVAAAKVIQNFSKKDEKIKVIAGSYEGKVLTVAEVAQLATIPSRDELLSMLLGVMQAPVAAFARGLGALAAKKAEDAAPAEEAPVAEVAATEAPADAA
ncbi:50S ribosomal protein L10 [Deefgea salmonis]|uniref:Large ribosomal subunit protein uL10 n=1 Tax=Deefgea salmonis TaxID=2875502 RepID=A0ABS8BNF3_9NEIS|nr:50S ribosomal protein L10 [Deefgea salmonis]MCB5197273.1 50S ribosomal protein L10 [Deefgea salmonis]